MCTTRKPIVDASCEHVTPVDVVAAIHTRIEQISNHVYFDGLASNVFRSFEDVFKPIPHVDQMPDEILCKINLKDASKTVDI